MSGQSIRSRAPAASSPSVRRVMQRNVGRETGPEERLRSALAAAGQTFVAEARPERSLRCKADVVFPEQHLCVFVDGCFWHGCPQHFALPKSNAGWWKEKIDANIVRDQRQTRELKARGWMVVRVWEHDNPSDAARRIARLVRKRAPLARWSGD